MVVPSAALLALLLLPPGDEVLSHDDGRQEAQRSTAGAGHAVRFERGERALFATAVRVYGSRYGAGYDPETSLARITLRDAAGETLAEAWAPYSEWKVGRFEWVEVAVGPCALPPSFLAVVEFFPTQSQGVYLGVDEDAGGHSSSVASGGSGPPRALDSGDWMVRVVATDRRPEVERPDLSDTEVVAYNAEEAGPPVDQRSTAGAGHAVQFKAPSGHRFVTGISLFGARYGGGYDPRATHFQVVVCDRKLRALARSVHPYSLFEPGDLRWVDVPIPPVLAPRDFYVLVHFDPAQTRGVYVGRWKERGGRSLSANPNGRGTKLERGLGWMMRCTLAASAGEQPLPDPDPVAAGGLDAAQLAELAARVDEAERDEDLARLAALAAEAGALDPAAAASLGRFQASDHFLLKSVGLTPEEGERLLALMEAAHTSLVGTFGVARVSAVEGRRTHLHVLVDEQADTKLFTSPSSEAFSLIVWRGPRASLRPPTNGGRPNVYGLCHELGHVLLGWRDDRHQWAHYVGSVVTDDVVDALGERAWIEPYDARPEGLRRFLREVEGVDPGRDSDAGVARLFYETGERLGRERFGPALDWIRENRAGEPFHAVRLYDLDDLRDALLAGGADELVVTGLFGE